MANGFCPRGLLLFLIYIDLFPFLTSYNVSDANNLLDNLFDQSGYNKLVQPNKQVIVYVGYTLQSVNSLDIKKQIFSTTGFFTLEWQDDRLKWNTSYGDIRYISVPEDRVWHPDLVVLNSINELQNNLGAERPVRINRNGKLVWKPMAMLSTFCETLVYFFPFDNHTCSLELTILDLPYSAVCLLYLKTPVDISSHQSQADWKVVKSSNYYNLTTICELFDYQLERPEWLEWSEWLEWQDLTEPNHLNPTLFFTMELERLPGHYIMIVICPTILTAVLTYAAFFLPIKSGVRIGYIITVVLAYAVLLTLFAETMPSSTKFPSVLVVLFTITLGMAFFLIIITIFVTRLYYKPKRSIAPNCMHSLLRTFRKLKIKLKCRARRIHDLEQTQALEDIQPTEEVDSVAKSRPLKPYSNKELAEFFDYFLFIVFTIFYIFMLAIIAIGTRVWFDIATGKL